MRPCAVQDAHVRQAPGRTAGSDAGDSAWGMRLAPAAQALLAASQELATLLLRSWVERRGLHLAELGMAGRTAHLWQALSSMLCQGLTAGMYSARSRGQSCGPRQLLNGACQQCCLAGIAAIFFL